MQKLTQPHVNFFEKNSKINNIDKSNSKTYTKKEHKFTIAGRR